MISPQQRLDRAMTEAALQASVRQLAELEGWRHYHTHDSRRSESGFPDSLMARDGRLIAAELKRETKQPTQAQLDWLAALEAAGVEAYIWRPSDWREGRIARVLGRADFVRFRGNTQGLL